MRCIKFEPVFRKGAIQSCALWFCSLWCSFAERQLTKHNLYCQWSQCQPHMPEYFVDVAPLWWKPDWAWLHKSILTDAWIKYSQTLNTRFTPYSLLRWQKTSVTLRGWTAYIHPAGLTDINEGTVWYNATSTFLTNQEWRLICLQFKWTLPTMGRYQPFMSLLWQEGKKPSSMKEPCFVSPPHCFPAVQTALSDSPDPQCLLPSFPTNGSEKYL